MTFANGRLTSRAGRRAVLLPLTLGLIAAGPPSAARARVPVRIAVAPQQAAGGALRPVGYLNASVRPGSVLRGELVVKNTGARSARVALDPVDALTTPNLGSAYKVRGLPIHGSTRWIRLARRRLTIAPGRSTAVAVSVPVPRKARAGDYLSGVSVQALNQRRRQPAPQKGTVVSSVSRYAIGVFVRLPGPRHPLIRFHGARVESQPAGVTFLLRAANEGNALLQNVRGLAEVSRHGARVLQARLGPGTFVTGTTTELPLVARSLAPQEGTVFHVKAVLRYRGGIARLNQLVRFGKRQAQTERAFRGPPAGTPGRRGVPWWVWPLVALPLAGTLGYTLRRRRSRKPLSDSALMAVLERELRKVEATGRPLSVVLVDGAPTSGPGRRELVAALRSRLRESDALGERSDGALALLLPDTGADAATGQAADLGRVLAGVNGGARVGTATAERARSGRDLLREAERDARS